MQIWSLAFRRFCQIPVDASNLLKNVTSALSAKISFLMGSGKPALLMLLFSSSSIKPETADFVTEERSQSVGPSVLHSHVVHAYLYS